MKREFFYRDDVSNKFWTVEQTDAEVEVASGRIGSHPRGSIRAFESEQAAQKWLGEQIAKKVAEGYREGAIAELEPWQAQDWSAMTMSDQVFWRIIALFDWKKLGDDDAVVRRAVAALASMDVSEIDAFADILAERLHALDTRVHC